MLIMRFRKEEDAKHLLKKVKKMREEIEDVEDLLEECMEDEDVNYRDDDYDDSDWRGRSTVLRLGRQRVFEQFMGHI